MSATDSIDNLWQAWQLRYAQGPLSSLLRQARLALLAVLPASWRSLLVGKPRQLWLRLAETQVQLALEGPTGHQALGELPLQDAELLARVRDRAQQAVIPRWLLLDARSVLRRQLSLPAAAEPRLRELLAFEIDRQTPFAADQVAYEARVVSRDAAGAQIGVELLALPKARLEAEIARLGALGVALTGVDVLADDGRPLGINLLPAAQRAAQDSTLARRNAMLAAVCVGLLLGAGLLTLENRTRALQALQGRVNAANDEVRQVRALRNQLQSSVDAANFLARKRAQEPTMLELVADLTRRIPDDTALDKLAVNQGRIVLVGQSRSAPALVGLLQQSPLLASPALAGAVQSDPRGGLDRFTLTASVASQGGGADASR